MLLSIREAFALFDEDQISKRRDTCSLSHFTRTRPQYVKLANNMPHNMCLCTYHSKYIEAVTTLCKKVQNIPNYDNSFVNHFLCKESSIACWYGNCEKCSGKFVSKMEEFVLNTPSTSTLKWSAWEKDVSTKRVEKKEKSGNMDELINYVNNLWPQFLEHSFNKREQALTFNEFDRPRALSTALVGEGLLQIDFAENYVCEAQDEVQNAHWNQRQLTLFKRGFYYNNALQAKVYVSDNLSHTKDTIVTYLWKLLSSLPSSLKILKISSDGPSSQFKNKFIAALIPYLEIKFGIKIFRNYFATSHGKGCVDGIGATVKTVVRKHVIARNIIK
ncbi:uncharacterized protein [Eurosta solidaginis]|uniref:uncharacterized protein n=1 Tax=Eurosta solidaginis TaxID=178769 RepID=UPI003531512B